MREPAQVVASQIPELIERLRDGNWPVAIPVFNLLLTGVWEAIVPNVSAVLKGDDPIWEYWCIELLVTRFPRSQVLDLSEELRTLNQSPSSAEVAEGVNVAAAKEILCIGG